MMYIFVFFVSWAAFAIFAQKDRFKELYQSSLIGMVMSLSSDIFTLFYPLWAYRDVDTGFRRQAITFLDDFGIYPVIAYLYVQHLPATTRDWFFYTFLWTLGGLIIEYILVRQKYLYYQLGWSLFGSYLSDWTIFIILTVHHLWQQKTQHPRKI
jgi:hypothetical protein